MSQPQAPWRLIGGVLVASSAFLAGWLLWPASPSPVDPVPVRPQTSDTGLVEQGRLLALQGNCAACHGPLMTSTL